MTAHAANPLTPVLVLTGILGIWEALLPAVIHAAQAVQSLDVVQAFPALVVLLVARHIARMVLR